ncbi:hypothetical protein DFJ43DRAFT_997896, partial [Lentinula guzmanii]
FRKLCDLYSWDRESDKRKEALAEIRNAIAQSFRAFYGSNVESLNGWPSPVSSIANPRQAGYGSRLQGRERFMVDICDLVDFEERFLKRMGQKLRLAGYRSRTGKIYPRDNAYAGGLFRFLWRDISGDYHGKRRNGGQQRQDSRKGRQGGSRRRRGQH